MKYLSTFKLFESIDELEQWLKDIFLELEHEGYEVGVRNSKSNFHSSAEMCGTYNVTIIKKSFKLSDIFETILTSESYMNDYDWFIYSIRMRTNNNEWFSLSTYDIDKLKNINKSLKELIYITYLEIEFKKNLL